MATTAPRSTAPELDPGAWVFTTRPPDARLRAHVGEYQGYVDSTTSRIDVHLPFGAVPVILGLGAPLRSIDVADGDTAGDVHTTFVAGLFEAATATANTGPSYGVQVNFTPVGAHRFLGVPMDQLTNRAVELDDIFGPEAHRLIEQMRDAPSWERRYQFVDDFLLHRMARARPAQPGVLWAWQKLVATRGQTSIGVLTDELGWSRKRLVERFREHVGLPPKTFARILRFNRVVDLMRMGESSWPEIAYGCGYYDQPHFIREFREFAGTTPTEYARRALIDDPARVQVA